MAEEIKIKKALTIENLYAKNFKLFEFDGRFADTFGRKVESTAVWFFYGHSGNGKTGFMLELAKYLTKFGKVCYNTLEEGPRYSFRLAAKRAMMSQVARKFDMVSESTDDLLLRMAKRRSPSVYIIDSFQHSGLNKKAYLEFKRKAVELGKMVIFVSHAQGRRPEGSAAQFAEYDADIKGMIDGYRFFPKSRYGGNQKYDIWPEMAARIHDNVQ